MIKFGILAIGEGGSNIGEYAAQKGIKVIALNTAIVDFKDLKAIKSDLRLHLEGWEGAGRNREIGKEAMITHSEKIYEKVESVFNDCDYLIVSGTTSGGTGSGGLPIGAEILLGLDKKVGIITTLPEISEGPKSHMNSLECFSELSKFESLGSVFIIDNEKAVKEVFKDKDKTEIFKSSNMQIIDNLYEISALCDQSSYISNFDKNDFLGIIEERGASIITKITISNSSLESKEDIVKAINDSLDISVAPKISSNQIVKAAIIGKLPKDKLSLIDSTMIFSNIGKPYDIIEAYYPNNESDNSVFYLILSGLSFPFDRLSEIEKSISNVENDLMNQVENSRKQKFETGNWTSKFKKKEEKVEKLSLAERLSKFK